MEPHAHWNQSHKKIPSIDKDSTKAIEILVVGLLVVGSSTNLIVVGGPEKETMSGPLSKWTKLDKG